MRTVRLVLLLTAVADVCACHPRRIHSGEALFGDHRPMKMVARLTCPGEVGELTRTGEAADGRSCSYKGPQSEDVQLRLTSLDGQSAQQRLAALDGGLQAEVPSAATDPKHGQGVYVSDDKDKDEAHIDLPGFHLNASHGKADIRMPGVNIDADDDNANVTTGLGGAGGASVRAHGGGAEIRAGGVGANGADVTYLLASDRPGPNGYRAAGYIAKGPAGGPLVVGEFRTREREHNGMGEHGLSRLVDLNVHG
jgi:hypothetical protein